MRSVNSKEGRSAARVLIAGAGPTGLMMALCLKQYGIDADIVDAKSGPSRDSKALAINPVSQLQSALIVGQEFLGENALKVNALSVNWKNKHRLCRIDLSHLDWPMKDMLIQTQYKTEKELVNKLEDQGSRIQWNTRLVSVKENESDIEVQLLSVDQVTKQDHIDSQDSARKQTYDYVIGCEGKRSIVRESIGTKMETRSYDMFLALADYQLNTDLDETSAHYCVFEDTFFVLVPLGEGIWRIVVKHEGALPDVFNDSLVKRPIEQLIGTDALIGEPLWKSMAPLYVSYPDSLQSHRLFIAGDAAHLYSPIGGTGMNTGFMDVINLAWKLAYQILGMTRGSALLDSYEQERLPAITENAMATDRMTQIISRVAKDDADTEPFRPLMKNRRFWRHMLPLSTAGYGLNYCLESPMQNKASLHPELSKILLACACYKECTTKSPVPLTTIPLITGPVKKLPLIKVLQFVEPPAEGLNESEPKGMGTAPFSHQGTESVLVAWHSENEIMMIDRHHLLIPQNLWQSLVATGEIKVVRPDGILIYESSAEAFHKNTATLFSFLKKEY